MSTPTSTTQPETADVNAQREASVLAGVTKPAPERTPSRASRASAKMTAKSGSKSAVKPAAPQSETTASSRKLATMRVMIDLCADAVSSEAAWTKFRTGVPLAEARAILAARLSYAPGGYWRPELDAPTVLQVGKRSKIARSEPQTRVTRPAPKTTSTETAAKPATPAKRTPKTGA